MAEHVECLEATAACAEDDEDTGRHEPDEGASGPLRALSWLPRGTADGAEMAPLGAIVPATPLLSTMDGKALLPSPTAESWEYPLTREEKFHRVLGLMEAELYSADGRANQLEARVQACEPAAQQAKVPADEQREEETEEEAEEKAKRLQQEILSMQATVARISQEARMSRWNARENVDLKGRIELCKSIMGALMTAYDFPEDLAAKMRQFLRNLVPTRVVLTADGEEEDEEDGGCRGPGDAGAGDEGVMADWRELNEAIQKAEEPVLRNRGRGEASRHSAAAQQDTPQLLADEESIWARSKLIFAELFTWSVDTSTVPPGAQLTQG